MQKACEVFLGWTNGTGRPSSFGLSITLVCYFHAVKRSFTDQTACNLAQVNYRSGAAPPPPSRSSQSRASAAASAASDATVNTSPAASAALVPLLQAAAAVEGKLLG